MYDLVAIFHDLAGAVPDTWGYPATWGSWSLYERVEIQMALAQRKLPPDQMHLRRAAEWLGALFHYNQAQPPFDRHVLTAVLEEKSALVHRLAWRHVPELGEELERPSSPLYAIDAAARFLPEDVSGHVEVLRGEMAAVDLPATSPPGADPEWHENRRRLQQLMLQDNPHRFLTWPVIINSMFMNDVAVARPELATLQKETDFATRWEPALREDALGAPARTALHPWSSNNLIHHAYNLLQLGEKVEALPTILEFGGGYGSTARLAHRLGFRGRYIIFDLPEFSALQRFYLSTLGFPLATKVDAPGIHCISSMDALIERLPKRNPDLFLATWSLSETPTDFRQQFVPFLLNAQRLLIAYQDRFGDADNVPYFAGLAGQLSHRNIRNYSIPHLPGNHYFVAGPA